MLVWEGNYLKVKMLFVAEAKNKSNFLHPSTHVPHPKNSKRQEEGTSKELSDQQEEKYKRPVDRHEICLFYMVFMFEGHFC